MPEEQKEGATRPPSAPGGGAQPPRPENEPLEEHGDDTAREPSEQGRCRGDEVSPIGPSSPLRSPFDVEEGSGIRGLGQRRKSSRTSVTSKSAAYHYGSSKAMYGCQLSLQPRPCTRVGGVEEGVRGLGQRRRRSSRTSVTSKSAATRHFLDIQEIEVGRIAGPVVVMSSVRGSLCSPVAVVVVLSAIVNRQSLQDLLQMPAFEPHNMTKAQRVEWLKSR